MRRGTAPPGLGADLLGRLEGLRIRSRLRGAGRLSGERRSPTRGRSVEFHDYRPYGPGDDLRYVDWNVYARLDRLHVKLFVDEEDLCLHLLVDASASMSFGDPSKLAWALTLAGALGFVGLVGLERVAVGLLRAGEAETWGPVRGRRRREALWAHLAEVRDGGGTELARSLGAYARRAPSGGVAVVVSDVLDAAGIESGLGALRRRGLEVHLVHVLDPAELDPAVGGEIELEDAETGERVEVSVDARALGRYRDRLDAHLAVVAAACRRYEVGYRQVTTAVPVGDFVLGSLRGLVLE